MRGELSCSFVGSNFLIYGWIESVSFGVDVIVKEVIPVVIFDNCALFQDSLGPGDGPSHSGLFHPIFDQRSTGAFDGAGSDGVAFFQIGSIVHHMPMIFKVRDGLLDGFFLVRGELVFGADLFESTHDVADVALQEGI